MPGQKVLLVEGSDDKHVMQHICGARHIGPLDEVIDLGGVEQLLKAIPVQAKLLIGEDDAMGVVIDADINLENRWQAVRKRFKKAGYLDLPNQPRQEGTLLPPPIDTNLPKAGVWVMPNNRTSGILEEFLAFLVPSDDALWTHAQCSVESIVKPSFKEQDLPKAAIHTWLAWQEEPGRPFGTAITARYLDPEMAEVDILADWLQKLFG